MMLATRSEIKCIPQKLKDLVIGYIKIERRSLNIPMGIMHICVLFSRECDILSQTDHHEFIEINQRLNIAKCKEAADQNPLFPAYSAYLDNIVSSGIHKWKFKYLSLPPIPGTDNFIGVFNTKYQQIYDGLFDRYIEEGGPPKFSIKTDICSDEYDIEYEGEWPLEQITGYGISITDSMTATECVYSYQKGIGLEIKQNDIIEMILDFTQNQGGTLSYILNDNDRGKEKNKAFDIEPGQYRAAISMTRQGVIIKLISYQSAQYVISNKLCFAAMRITNSTQFVYGHQFIKTSLNYR